MAVQNSMTATDRSRDGLDGAARVAGTKRRVLAMLSGRTFQYLVGSAVVVFAPSVVRWPDQFVSQLSSSWIGTSIVGGLLSFVIGLTIIRQLVRSPHADGPVYLIPVFIITFGAESNFKGNA